MSLRSSLQGKDWDGAVGEDEVCDLIRVEGFVMPRMQSGCQILRKKGQWSLWVYPELFKLD